MAAQVRIVFTPVLNALKSGLAQAKNMIQGALDPLQKTVGPFGGAPFGFVAGAKTAGNQFAGLRDEIIATINKYRDLQHRVEGWGLSSENAAKVTAALQTQMEGASDALARKVLPNFKEVEAALRAAGYEGGVFGATTEQINNALNKTGKSAMGVLGANIIKLGKTLGSSGRRLSWFGFRLLMVGRVFTRFITKTLRGAIQGFTRWDDNITQIGTSLGFLAASGLLTADIQNMMVDAMKDLPKVGMQVQGIMGAISALFINMGSDIIPILGGSLIDLIRAISDIWEASKGDLIPIFERLANETIPRFIEILRSVGPDAIAGFVTGIESGINSLTGLLDVLEPHLPAFSAFLGYLVGLAPIITAVGMSLFFASVPLQIVSSLISTAGGLLSGLKSVAAAAISGGTSFMALGGALLIVAGFVGALILWWDHLVGFWQATVGPAITRLFTAFGKLGEALGGAKTGMGLLKAATLPFALALDVVMLALTAILTVITKVISAITWLVNAFKTAGQWLTKIFGGSEDAINSFKDTHDDMIDDLKDTYDHSIGDIMAEQYDTARTALEQLMESQMNPTVIPQTIPIEISITIENMSSEIDLDTMTDEVSRKLAGKIEGVFR